MKTLAILLSAAAALASAQTIDLRHLDRLAEKTDEVVNVTLDENLIRLAGSFLKGAGPELAEVRKILPGLRGIYVRSYNFDRENAYAASDVEKIEQQLKGWSTVVEVRKGRSRELTKVMISQGKGIVVLTSGPRELSVVDIEGSVTMEQLEKLGGQLGIPEIDLKKESGGKSKPKDDEE